MLSRILVGQCSRARFRPEASKTSLSARICSKTHIYIHPDGVATSHVVTGRSAVLVVLIGTGSGLISENATLVQ